MMFVAMVAAQSFVAVMFLDFLICLLTFESLHFVRIAQGLSLVMVAFDADVIPNYLYDYFLNPTSCIIEALLFQQYLELAI